MAAAAPWPPERDAEAIAFAQWLESEKYGGHADTLAWFRWGSEWRMHMANNSSDGEARRRISVNIDEIRAGKPTTTWAAGPYDLPWSPEMDAEVESVAEKARQLFADHERALDHLGRVRWFSDYRLHRAQGLNADAAWKRIERDIKALWGIVEPAPPAQRPLKGVLRLVNGRATDDTGLVNPLGLHFMEMFSLWARGKRDVVKQEVEHGLGEGYQVFRHLNVLGYYDCAKVGGQWVNAPDGWHGRAVTPLPLRSVGAERFGWPVTPATPGYYEEVMPSFLEAMHAAGAKVYDDRGDLNAFSDNQKVEHMRRTGQIYRQLGTVGREVLAGVFACNESWQNGVDNPALGVQMLEAFRDGAGWWPDIRGIGWGADQNDWSPEAIRAGAGELPKDLIYWSPNPCTVCVMHGSRVASREHLIGHYLGYGFYDGELARRNKRTLNLEPFGGGRGVSVSEVNDPELHVGAAAVAQITGQWWVQMGGNNVFYNGALADMPGYREVARLAKWLPNDLHEFNTIGHSGIRFRGTRFVAAIDDPATRLDYAIHPDGRLMGVLYGKGAHLPFERPCSEFEVIDVVGDRIQSSGRKNVGDRITDSYPVQRLVRGRLA